MSTFARLGAAWFDISRFKLIVRLPRSLFGQLIELSAHDFPWIKLFFGLPENCLVLRSVYKFLLFFYLLIHLTPILNAQKFASTFSVLKKWRAINLFWQLTRPQHIAYVSMSLWAVAKLLKSVLFQYWRTFRILVWNLVFSDLIAVLLHILNHSVLLYYIWIPWRRNVRWKITNATSVLLQLKTVTSAVCEIS